MSKNKKRFGIVGNMSYEREMKHVMRHISPNGEPVTDLGKEAAMLFHILYRGIHNMPTKSLTGIDWGDDYVVSAVVSGDLSTVDMGLLTKAVALAHHMKLRLTVEGASKGKLRILCWKRQHRNLEDGHLYQWCPTLEDHAEMLIPAWLPFAD